MEKINLFIKVPKDLKEEEKTRFPAYIHIPRSDPDKNYRHFSTELLHVHTYF